MNLTVVSGDERQMTREHFDKDGNLIWRAENQTHSAVKAISESGETFILQEVDNWRFVGSDSTMIGQEFAHSVGPDRVALSFRVQFVFQVVGEVVRIDQVNATCDPA